MINVELDKEVTFDLPPGLFGAALTQIKTYPKQTSKGKQDWVRLIFEVEVKGMENLECRAGRNFPLSFKAGSDLRNFLAPILGSEFFKTNSAKKLDIEGVLIGKRGTVTLSHFLGQNNDKPFVVVESFEPKILPTTAASEQTQQEEEAK